MTSLDRLRDQLRGAGGAEYWRRLDDLAGSPDFLDRLRRELPREAASLDGPIHRREFVTLLGAMLALGGLSGCGKPPAEKIVPTTRQPEGTVPGRPLFYATAMPFPGGATGLLVRTDSGRPTKIEGNPLHPGSLGATDAWAQAEIYSFWDPDRAQAITKAGDPATWPAFLGALSGAMTGVRERKGDGLRILTEGVTSPTLAAQLEGLLQELPAARCHSYEPIGRESVRLGSQRAFGTDVEPIYRMGKADVVLALDADVLCGVRYSHDFAGRRRTNRLYAVETMPTATGAMADHRWPARPSEIDSMARDLARELGVLPRAEGTRTKWIPAVASDLKRHAGASLVVAGREQSPAVHALAAGMNHALGNVGRTLVYIDPPVFGRESLAELVTDMAAGKVAALLVIGGNPVYTAPADGGFAEALGRVPFRAHLAAAANETSWQCHWHVPEAHFLESWSDTLAYDGTASIIQPVIAPLYEGRTAHELIAAVAGDPGKSAYDIVRDHWKRERGDRDFEPFWQSSLHDGIIPRTARPARRVTPKLEDLGKSIPDAEGLEISFRPDPTVWDGRFANNPWLQELPKPITKLTWDNAAMMAPATASPMGLSNGDVVTVSHRGRTVRAPVWIVPGHADRSVTLHLGYGRTKAGRIGNGTGFNAYALRSAEALGMARGAALRKTGERMRLASTQNHFSMDGREPVRVTTVQDLSRHPGEKTQAPSLYPEDAVGENAWGMVIDLGTCTGCNACVVACQVENNVPIVGKNEVLRSREMHWLRIDTYREGPAENPVFLQQPVPCMHCEKAPCEVVCPTYATAHSSEGLNQMVYNRCVGTRYCQNNCPYKVRRFNFFRYADVETPQIRESYNPDVTVRERGVMEKCTYCVQRITRARIEAEKEGRPIRDGEVRTACQQACPNGAIVFGNLADRTSEVARLRSSPLNYALLGELNTRPRTTYLARVRNPNPEIEGT